MQVNRGTLEVWRVAGAGVCLAWLLSGCEAVHEYSLTYKVWDNDDWCKWNEPAASPHLALYDSSAHTNLLVQYDAYSEKHSAVRRQAYYMQPNQARVDDGRAPRFVDPVAVPGLEPIPVFEALAMGTNLPAHLTNYAVLAESGKEFSLHPQAEPLGDFRLPVYRETSGTVTRVALTPFAVVGDTVMVGLVASVVALYWACSSGYSFTP